MLAFGEEGKRREEGKNDGWLEGEHISDSTHLSTSFSDSFLD